MVRAIVVCLALSCLAAPAWAQPAPPTGRIAAKPAVLAESGPCIGVIPIIGNRFVLRKAGVLGIGNTHAEIAVDSWGLDDLVVAKVRAAANPRIAVRRIPFARSVLALPKNRPIAIFRDVDAEWVDLVRQIAASTKCERYVLITRIVQGLPSTSQTVNGIGILQYGLTPYIRNYVFALSSIRVYDGRTFALLKKSAAATAEPPSLASVLEIHPIRGPNRELDKSTWPASPAEAAKSSLMRDTVRELLAQSLEKTLPELLAP